MQSDSCMSYQDRGVASGLGIHELAGDMNIPDPAADLAPALKMALSTQVLHIPTKVPGYPPSGFSWPTSLGNLVLTPEASHLRRCCDRWVQHPWWTSIHRPGWKLLPRIQLAGSAVIQAGFRFGWTSLLQLCGSLVFWSWSGILAGMLVL